MEQNAITQLERELIFVLKEEYSFYQSLYVMLDKQRDLIKYDKDEHLLDLFAEIERCHQRIRKSEQRVEALKERNPRLFQLAAVQPDVRKVARNIATLVSKNVNLVNECQEYMQDRYDRIKLELGELKSSHKILQYLAEEQPSPQFIDGKE